MQFAILLLLLCPLRLQAASIEPPLVGRPTHAPFSGAVGSFHPSTRAAPTELQAEDPLTYTIRVTAEGQVLHAPQRPDLRDLPAFAEGFYIEDLATPDEAPSGRQGWEFVYRLKPRSPAVRSVPSFPLVYYQPGMLPGSKGFMTRWAPAIELRVWPREQVRPTELQGGKPLVGPPATVYQFAEGEEALRREENATLPGPVQLALLALAPPAGCVAWFLVWRRLYPDAARQAVRRRSRAASLALKKLRSIGKAPLGKQAEQASAIVADYLRERFEFPAVEPTPVEVASHLDRAGLSATLVDQSVRFFHDCAATRFRQSPSPDWPAVTDAVELILAVEAASWKS